METEQHEMKHELGMLFGSITIIVVLTTIVIVSFSEARMKNGTIILPGGITYLGPTPTK